MPGKTLFRETRVVSQGNGKQGLEGLPRMYLATPAEVGQRLRETAGGRGATILYESHTWTARAVTTPRGRDRRRPAEASEQVVHTRRVEVAAQVKEAKPGGAIRAKFRVA